MHVCLHVFLEMFIYVSSININSEERQRWNEALAALVLAKIKIIY